MLHRLARMATAATVVLAVAAPLAHADSPTAFVYASDSNAQLPQYSADGGGALTALTPAFAPATATSSGLVASPDGHTVYAVDQPTDDVSQYRVGADGTLTRISVASVPEGSAPFDIALAPDGRHAYVANQLGGSISVFAVAADGTLVAGPTTVDSGAGTMQVAISPDGTSAYAVNASDGTISQYDVDPGDGTLTPKSTPTLTAGSAPYGITVSPDGHSVYVANRVTSGTIRQYDVGADGALTPKATETVAALSRPVRILADDHAVYVTNFASDRISRYTAGADGALTQVDDVATPHSPFGMALSPDGHSLYVAGSGDATVGQYDVADDGALTAKTPATVAADVRPLSVAAVRAPDAEPPSVDLRTPADGAQYEQGSDVTVDYSCADTGTSGLASCTGDLDDGAALDTSTVGTFGFSVTARDGDGNKTTVKHSYTVTAPPEPPESGFDFVGPIHDGSVVKAGSVVPIAFSLGGEHGLDVLADGSPSSVRVDCGATGVASGGSPAHSADGLQFDAAKGVYTFAWQTRSSWAGTCRAFQVTLQDGSAHQLVVKFCRTYSYHWRRHH
jgi:6-phosphogluconolactonase (cycloisomerase 2 family)